MAEGRARNHAARLAVLEHLMKFIDEGDEQEQLEVIRLTEELWVHGVGVAGARKRGISAAPFTDLMSDKDRPWAVRVAAATAIARNHWADVKETIFEALASEGTDVRDDSYSWFYNCGLALSRYGEQEDEDRLRSLELEAPWKRKLVATVLDEMAAGRPK